MSISWGNWDVRINAAEAWVSLSQRFATDHPQIIDQFEAILTDPIPAVRLQVAQNLQVICVSASERMWAMGERLARDERDPQILTAYLGHPMLPFCNSEPERCEAILSIVRSRLDGNLFREGEGRDHVQEALGHWTAQLYASQGRPLLGTWLKAWATAPTRYATLLNAYSSSLRGAYFYRYDLNAEQGARNMYNRAKAGLHFILSAATSTSGEAYAVLTSDAGEEEKKAAGTRYGVAERVIHHAMSQLFFGVGVNAHDKKAGLSLPDREAMTRFLRDYADILELLEKSHEPSTLHYLIELYEFLIPGDPPAVFDVIHHILLGRGEAEGYQNESLGNTAMVRIVGRYIADHRSLFEDDLKRGHLIAILQLFSEVGWTDALRLLYDLPDLLR